MKFTFLNIITSLFVLFFFTSCVPRKQIVYMSDLDSQKPIFSTSFEPVLEPNDLLSIVVASENPELTLQFNLPQLQTVSSSSQQTSIKNYLIDHLGYIDFPVLGKVQLGGLTKSAANKLLVTKISEYFKNPVVNLNIVNYKVTMLGEVGKSGSIQVSSERITLLEAISQAGDLTLYGKRDNILIIREENGKKSYNRIDITNSDFLKSDFYYLKQNDLVYVEPNKTKVNGAKIGASTGLYLSVLSIVLTISFFIINKN